MKTNDPSGRITEIQRFSLHDGPGIRTTVFLKGCPLRCPWCHNPECLNPGRDLAFHRERCIRCGRCVPACPARAIRLKDSEDLTINRNACNRCGACVEACPAQALELIGRDLRASDVLRIVLRDRAYYESSGGGITLSGGEPLHQPDFSQSLLKQAQAEGLHTTLETCGYAESDILTAIRPHVDLFLFDLKETNPDRHKTLTGVDNARILANLRDLHARGDRIRLRCPMIPGTNDTPGHIAGIIQLANELPDIEGVELMPYHRMGTGKADRLGLAMSMINTIRPPEKGDLDRWIESLRAAGVAVFGTDKT